jgi:hypothetical protein
MSIKSTEEIKAELSECYMNGQHVLLYGNSSINPKTLVLDVHIENGGRTDTVQYVGREKEEVFLEKIAEAINNDRLKNKDERKRYEEAKKMYKSSEKSWRSLRGIHQVGCEVWRIVRVPFGCGMSLEIKGNEFLDFKGTLFVDMLDYSPDNDAEYLCKLAGDIKEGNVSWLVGYIYNGYDDAPKSFLKQFVHIQLPHELKSESKQQEGEVGQPDNCEFSLSVNTWKISFEGKTIHPRDSIGFKYIHCLVRNPDKEFKVIELIREIKKSPPPKDTYNGMNKEQTEEQLIEDGLSKGSTGEVIDERAIKEYKNRYNELVDELEDETIPKSDETIAEIKEEIEKISKALNAGCDIHGQPRRIAGNAEKARRAVSKAIIESLDKIKDEQSGHSALWKHFENTLTIGIYCSYKPEKPIPWNH